MARCANGRAVDGSDVGCVCARRYDGLCVWIDSGRNGEKVSAPTEVAPDDARHDYIARVYKMSHAELFAELMRVHTEANRLATDLQAQIDELKKESSSDCAGV